MNRDCNDSPQGKTSSKRLNRDCNVSPQGKTAPLPEPPNIHQMAAIRADSVSTDQVQQEESIFDIYSHPMFDTLENLGDSAIIFQFLPLDVL
ncbi:hypothetical protein SUGI_1109710 [Cryptomeria japonica]|nr:hypothetical protein SUGI_1109710 [Cryptomeria japonica]